jgi:hypothetical protein
MSLPISPELGRFKFRAADEILPVLIFI